MTPSTTLANAIGFGNSASELWGADNESTGFSLMRFTIDREGITQTGGPWPGLMPIFRNRFQVSHGLLYLKNTWVVDPGAKAFAGRFTRLEAPDKWTVFGPDNDGGMLFTRGPKPFLQYYVPAARQDWWDAVELITGLRHDDPSMADIVHRLQTTPGIPTATLDRALKMLASQPESAEVFDRRVIVPLASPSASPEDYRQAIRNAREALKRSPHNKLYLVCVALGHYRLGEYREGLALLSSKPGDYSLEHSVLALLKYRTGESEEARWHLKAARDYYDRYGRQTGERRILEEAEETIRNPR